MTENITSPDSQNSLLNEIHFSYLAEFIEDAEDLFIEAKDTLFDINNWAKMSGLAGIEFILTDAHKKNVHRNAHMGDHIRIEKDNKIYWLHVDVVEYDDYPDENRELFVIFLKPINFDEKPIDPDKIISLSIERINTKLFAYGHFKDRGNTNDIDNQLESKPIAYPLPILSNEEWARLLKSIINF